MMLRRERILVGIVGLVIGGWILDATVVEPALAALAQVRDETRAAEREVADANALVDRQQRILADWRGRHAAGLLDDEGGARFHAQQVLTASARSSGFTIDSIGGGQLVNAAREQAYDLVRLTVSGQGSLSQAQAFVAGIEAAAMPLRIERCEFAATDPRQDRIDVALTVSTRIASPAARAGRSVPDGTLGWKPDPRDAGLDAAVLAAKPFLSDRSAPRRSSAVVEERPAGPTGWALVGIVAREPGAVAFLRDLASGDERLVRSGEELQGGKVGAIDDSGLHLTIDGQERVVTVGSDLAGKTVAVPTTRRGAGASATPSPPAAAVAPATAPAAGTPPPSATPDADREAILQRLRQQRNRNQ